MKVVKNTLDEVYSNSLSIYDTDDAQSSRLLAESTDIALGQSDFPGMSTSGKEKKTEFF